MTLSSLLTYFSVYFEGKYYFSFPRIVALGILSAPDFLPNLVFFLIGWVSCLNLFDHLPPLWGLHWTLFLLNLCTCQVGILFIVREPDVFRGDEAEGGKGAEEAGSEKVRKMLVSESYKRVAGWGCVFRELLSEEQYPGWREREVRRERKIEKREGRKQQRPSLGFYGFSSPTRLG